MDDTAPTVPNNPLTNQTQTPRDNADWNSVIETEIKRQLAAQEAEVKADSERLTAKEKSTLSETPPETGIKLEPEKLNPEQPEVLTSVSAATPPTQNTNPPISPPTPVVSTPPSSTPKTSLPLIKEEIAMKPKPKPDYNPKEETKSPFVKPSETIETNLSSQQITEPETNLDPLRASIENAFNDLKVGTAIGKEWVVKKIITTNFGNNKSSFYELENQAGRLNTLNKEEIKDLIKNSLLGKDSEEKLPDLSPPKEEANHKTSLTHDEERVSGDQNPASGKKPEFKEENKESRFTQLIPKVNLFKEKSKEIQLPSGKTIPASTSHSVSDLSLNPEQIELIKTMHQNQKQWKTFTSLSSAQWEKVSELYEQGKLSEIGIDANPVTDFLNNPDIGSLIEVKKGESFTEILRKNDYKISLSKEDAPILGVHVIANHKLLEETHHKVENSGISLQPLPKDKEVINLVVSAQAGSAESLNALIEALQFIPVNQRIKIISKDDVDKLAKYFKF